MEIRKKELNLLKFFRNNARLALTKISRETGIPVSTIFDKLKKYDKTIITKHTCLIDFNKMGYHTRAAVFLKTDPQTREELRLYLKMHPNINNVYRINNGYDFLAEMIFISMQELELFLESLEINKNVIKKEVYFVMEEISRENFLTT